MNLAMTARGGRRARAPRRGRVAALVAAVSCAVLLAGSGVASAATSVHAAAARVHWGRAVEVPGSAALNAGGNAAVNAVSCWRAGDCAAGGFYTDAGGDQQAFVVTESSGVWGKAVEVPGTAGLNAGGSAQVTVMSCAPGGYCGAAGYYHDSKGGQQVFVASQTSGRWGAAHELPGTGKLNVGGLALVHSVSCPSAGSCAAGGYYQTYNPPGSGYNSFQAFVASEHDGQWARAEEVPGMQALAPPPYENNSVTSVSCASAGNCTAGGHWDGRCSGVPSDPCPLGFVLNEVNGRWHRLVQPKNGGPPSSVSCWHAGDCTAVGTYYTGPCCSYSPPYNYGGFAETQTNGRWGTARRFAALSGDVVKPLSCPSAGNCVAGGNLGYDQSDVGGYYPAFVFTERNGRWGKVDDLAGPAGQDAPSLFPSLSCASAGNCGAGGSYIAGFDQYGNALSGAWVVGERNGRWTASLNPPGLAALDLGGNAGLRIVSCPSASTCSAGGFYTDAAGHAQAFVDGSK